MVRRPLVPEQAECKRAVSGRHKTIVHRRWTMVLDGGPKEPRVRIAHSVADPGSMR
jgi:hypothetical protein